MSETQEGVRNTWIPQWDLIDRMRKTLEAGGIDKAEMAEFLEVHPNTITNWLARRTRPRSSDIRAWAERCGVPFDWLKDGDIGRGGPNRLDTPRYRVISDQPADPTDPPSVAEIKSYIRRGIGNTAVVQVTGGDMS